MDYKKELEIALTCYITEKHTQEECTGFIAGFEALQEVVENINYDTVLETVACINCDHECNKEASFCEGCGAMLD